MSNDKAISDIAAVVLAAGLSKRCGSQNKLLKAFDGKTTLIEKTIETIEKCHFQEIVVVIGYQSDLIKEALKGKKVRFLYNKDFKTGLSSSLKCAVSALKSKYDGICIFLADMPHIENNIVYNLYDYYRQNPSYWAICPEYKGISGHPVLLKKALYTYILELEGDKGAKSVLKRYQNKVYYGSINNPAILQDYDYIEDFRGETVDDSSR